ncbi:FAD-binding protein [Marinilabiliaceae bacterium JC040]|nr:FAD-binding protein [Marinilabiliaceae bacterium JC040]
MYKDINISLSPKESSFDNTIKRKAAEFLKIKEEEIKEIQKIKSSIDARRRNIKVNLRLRVWIGENPDNPNFSMEGIDSVKTNKSSKSVIIVGAGPAGLFAALLLIRKGIKPIILERGKCVEERKLDIRDLYRSGIVNTESNFSFGEGGAGTFSDGKLFTRSKKRGNVNEILQILHYYGAQEDILWKGHPHVGTDVLSKIIVNIRKDILNFGGEIHFKTKVTNLIVENKNIKGVKTENKDFKSDNVILATGHSAKDVYKFLEESNIKIESKDFAVGVRLEHPQALIDQIQYHSKEGRGKYLPAAEYSFVGQFSDRGVFSFCMCPGGIVVPASTEDGLQVVNGMSSSGRNTIWANSAMVCQVRQDDLLAYKEYGNLAGLYFQEDMEKIAYKFAGGKLKAPAQRMKDFVERKFSNDFPKSSYKMGLTSCDMYKVLPNFVSKSLKEAFISFGKKANGFLTNEAVMIGVETRTSSPVRIPRDRENMEHVQIQGLYPCGEGAGYAGGIVSAAMDGYTCASRISEKY